MPVPVYSSEDHPLIVRPMIEGDLTRVMDIERLVYSAPWSRQVFLQDLTSNALSRYVVAERGPSIVGYAGIWIFEQVGHVTTVAVHPQQQRRGYGAALMDGLLDIGRKEGVARFTLEVRVSNRSAQELYRRYGFYAVGIRPKYYQDNKEDALIMWTDPELPGYDRGFTG